MQVHAPAGVPARVGAVHHHVGHHAALIREDDPLTPAIFALQAVGVRLENGALEDDAMAAAIRGNKVAECAERDITATGDELEAVAAAGRVVAAAIEVEPLDGQEPRLANEPNGGGHPVPVGRFQAQAVTVEVDASVANVPQADFQSSADLDRWGRAVEGNTTAIVAGGLKERLQFLLIGRPREAASLNGDAATRARAGSRLGARLCWRIFALGECSGRT